MSARRRLQIGTRAWRLREPFVISRGTRTHAEVVVVEIAEDGHAGRGEAGGVAYHGETPDSMRARIESVRDAIEAGCSRAQLLDLLPAGGARHAVDAALWDLEAKQSGTPAWQLAKATRWEPVASAITIGIRDLHGYEEAARRYADHPWLKVKVSAEHPVEAIAAVRRGAPGPRLIVDANQAWTVPQLRDFAVRLRPFAVDLIEQPVMAGEDDALSDVASPIPLCADESLLTVDDLPRLQGRYACINIKLDKVGGLTAGLALAEAAHAHGFRLMVGCMLGGSISVAPAMVLAQRCEVCDLDAPWLLAEDWPHPIVFEHGVAQPPSPELWG